MSTPGEDSPHADGATPSRSAGAQKNKQCPFCHESFTSSSLGRHLDLYIRDKNPKAADGIHDVEKIREIRGVITRRQPKRTTTKIEEGSTPSTGIETTGTPQVNGTSSSGGTKGKREIWVVNKPSWHATGVMTDIPPTPTSRPDPVVHRHSNRADAAIRRKLADNKMRLRAAELALQELLDSINAARTTEQTTMLFEFDFLGQTFPALCLKMLPQQPTLGSVQVIENPNYCPMAPPGQAHYEQLLQLLQKRLEEVNQSKTANSVERSSQQSGRSGPEAFQTVAGSHDGTAYTAHLTQAWDVWKVMSEARKVSQWHLEVMRAYSVSQDEQKRLAGLLARAEAEQAHLRLQIERLNECQQPKEFTYQIPANWHIPKKAAMAFTSDSGHASLDRETLINRWTTTVQANSRIQQTLPRIGPADTMADLVEMELEDQDADGDQDNEDGDSIDAAGEDDEDAEDLANSFAPRSNTGSQKPRPETNFSRQDALNPVMQSNVMDIDPGEYASGMLLNTQQRAQIH